MCCGCAALLHVSLNNNSVGTKRAVAALGQALKRNSTLDSLSLTQVGLVGALLGPLALGLTVNRTLRTLNLSTNHLDVNWCNGLKVLLESAASVLQFLDLSSCKINAEAMRVLALGLSHVNCRLSLLNVGSNELGVDGLNHVLNALTINRRSPLSSLIAFRNRFGAAGAKVLGKFLLAQPTRFVFLHLGHNKV